MKKIFFLLSLAVLFAACGNSNSRIQGDPNSPVAQMISLTREGLELEHRLDNPRLSDSEKERIEDQLEKVEGRMEGIQSRYWDYKLTEADRQMLRDFLENDLPKYGRHASKKDYRLVESAVTMADLE